MLLRTLHRYFGDNAMYQACTRAANVTWSDGLNGVKGKKPQTGSLRIYKHTDTCGKLSPEFRHQAHVVRVRTLPSAPGLHRRSESKPTLRKNLPDEKSLLANARHVASLPEEKFASCVSAQRKLGMAVGSKAYVSGQLGAKLEAFTRCRSLSPDSVVCSPQ